jgi:hypothetical protein
MVENVEIANDWSYFPDMPSAVTAGDQMIVHRNGRIYRASVSDVSDGVSGQQSIQTAPSENQAITSGDPSILDFDDVEFSSGDSDFSVSGGRITVFQGGTYFVSITSVVAAVAAALSQVTLLVTVNGNVINAARSSVTLAATEAVPLSVGAMVRLNAGDVVDSRLAIVQAIPGSGSAAINAASTVSGINANAANRMNLARAGR